MAKDKEESLGGLRSFQVSANLRAIVEANQGIELSAADVRNANNGVLVLAGVGSNLPVGDYKIVATLPHLTQRGCIEKMTYGRAGTPEVGSEDLFYIVVDGNFYSGSGNLNDFREILEKAAFHMKCINFCWNSETHFMSMLNVYPQCCCRCEQTQSAPATV